ncbi:MAG: HAMP domain-containing histidine kinase [Acidobacteriota bacterium]|nr:HAMP domain-containing histidine kinase [Acidobacteriota bacterium]
MTFRARVIGATVGVAAVAVVLACLASFLTTRNAILRSVDESLLQASHSPAGHLVGDDSQVTGSYFELVLANGQTVPKSNVPIDATILRLANGHGSELIRTVEFGGQYYRELIVPLPANSIVGGQNGLYKITTTSAQLFVVNITGQENELRHLVRTLLFVAAGGLALALVLGLALARTALHPLEEVTDEIERVAETNDMTYRVDEGGADELGRLRRVFNRLLASVQSSQYLQRQLVLDASHELRTPLTSLRTNAQVLSRARDLSAEDLRQLTDDMVAQVDELAALVTDLGELARGERSEGEPVVLRLDECVDECVDTARTHARVKDITIEAEVDASMVVARRDRLVRAISNLLTNAVKFTPAGGRIRVTSEAGRITVADSGPGIAESDRPHVFDRFWRSASARALPGSGLGLSIVAQVVAELQGTVEVDNDPELGGARFVVTLPTVSQP